METLELQSKSGLTIKAEIVAPYLGDGDTEFDVEVTAFDGAKVIKKVSGKYIHGKLARNNQVVYGYVGEISFSDSGHADAINEMVEAKRQQIKTAINNKMQQNVPGYEEVKSALQNSIYEMDTYFEKSEKYLDSESPAEHYPHKQASDDANSVLASLANRYPRASLFVKAEGWANLSNNHKKNVAGKEAMKAIRNGADLETVIKQMNSWSESAIWD